MVFRNQVNVIPGLTSSFHWSETKCVWTDEETTFLESVHQPNILCHNLTVFFVCLSLCATVTFTVADGLLLLLFPQPPQTLRLVSLHFQQEVTCGMSSVNLKRRIILRINREHNL